MYQTFKNVSGPIKNYLADPVQDCIAGNFFNGHDNPTRYDIGRCSRFMGERCSRQWDGYCDLYLREQIDADFVGKAANEFLLKALDAQFCTVDKNTVGSDKTCFTKCEQMDPLAPDSAMICQTEGNYVYRTTDKMYNIDTQYNALGRLSTPSPIRIAECPRVCNLLTEDKLTDNNRILNECLDRGIGGDILVNIATNAISNGVKITNTRFNRFIDSFVLKNSNSLKPGFSSLGASPMLSTVKKGMPASNPVIEPNTTYMQTDSSLFGPQMVKESDYQTIPEKEAFSAESSSSPKPRFVGMNLDRESFYYNDETKPETQASPSNPVASPVSPAPIEPKKQTNSTTIKLLYIALCICVVIFLYILLFTK